MRNYPLLPLLRSGLFVALSMALLCRPRPLERPKWGNAEKVPPVFAVDLNQSDAPGLVDLQPPPTPFRGQVTTCKPRVHTAINGGCWRRLADTPPCEDAYRWREGCYLPVMTAERPATSLGE